jgi:Chalcone isomerase-like
MKMNFSHCLSVLAIILSLVGTAAHANTLPVPVAKEHTGLSVRGETLLRVFGFKVYDARLWTQSKAHSYDDMFALELVYAMGFKGKDIADRSVEEMRKVGIRDEAKLMRWGSEMARIFPDIQKGEALIGVFVPNKEVRFFTREKLIATVADPEFAKAFFDIWLSEKTSEPKLREKLLGSGVRDGAVKDNAANDKGK